MNTLRLKPLSLALITALAGVSFAQATYASVEARLHEDIDVVPGRVISPADEAVISSSASRVLHHIARARNAVGRMDGEQARQELKQAETLLDIIQNTVPTTLVKSRVWTADNKLKYENSEEIPAAIVPIYASLDERAEFDRVKLPGSAQGDKKPAGTEVVEARDAALYFEELDLPLNTTRHFVAVAQTELANNRLAVAGQALRAALDSMDFTSVYLPAPLLAARINLDRAAAHFGAGQTQQARADVSRAITQLTAAEKQADPEALADVKQMLSDAQSLQTRMDQPGFKAELESLLHRVEVHADRAMAYTTYGWARLRQRDPLRGALIEAKRYVAYADIDANLDGDTNQARHDLEQARSWLDKAADATTRAPNGEDSAVYVKDLRAVVDTLLAGQARPDAGEMANLTQQLTRAIAR